MKLATNFVAGFMNSAWSAIIGLAVVPFYLRYLGLDAYGLVGFFVSLQAVLQLLDVGLSPTVNREVARGRAQGTSSETQRLLATLVTVYWLTAGVIAICVILAAPYIGDSWLQSRKLQPGDVKHAVMLMGVIAACRWPVGFYLGALMGAERFVIANAISAAVVTVSNVGAVAVLAWISPTVEAFFMWQAAVSLFHVLVIRHFARAVLGRIRPGFELEALSGIWRFSAGMSLVAVLGTVFLQLDKVVLSRIVSLSELGRYTLAGLVARTLYLLLTPAFSALFPRMSAIVAEGRTADLEQLYRLGTRVLMALVFPLATFVSVFSVDLVTLWTGKADLARGLSVVIPLMLLGTAMNGAMHMPYALQLAYGRPSLPVRINLILMVAFIPLLFVFSNGYGILGAAAAWALLNILYVLIGTWMTHRELLPGLGAKWLLGDVGIPLVISVSIAGGGGFAVRSLALPVIPNIILGSALAAVAVGVTALVSPAYMVNFRQTLLGRSLIQ